MLCYKRKRGQAGRLNRHPDDKKPQRDYTTLIKHHLYGDKGTTNQETRSEHLNLASEWTRLTMARAAVFFEESKRVKNAASGWESIRIFIIELKKGN